MANELASWVFPIAEKLDRLPHSSIAASRVLNELTSFLKSERSWPELLEAA
jgi:hypothetical protein